MKLFESLSRATSRDYSRQRNRRSRRFLRWTTTSCFSAILLASGAIAADAPAISWTQLSPAISPPSRSYLAMTYDAVSRQVIVFGGFDGAGYLNDTWTFDGITWRKIDTSTAPSARANAQMAYDRHIHKVVLFGGYNGRYLGDTWLWDGITSTWTQVTPMHSPKAVTGPMVFPDPNGRVDEFGGFDGQFYQATMWQWNGTDWKPLHPAMVPYARSSAAVGVDVAAQRIVMFGGLADVNPDNTWTYDGTTWTLQSPSTQPPSVYASSSVFDPNLNSVILFGGGLGGIDQSSTWAWPGSDWKQVVPTQSPGAREGAGIAYDVTLGHVILFGGQNREVPTNDTWEFTP